jgi:serine/threonine-protein kinase RsbT
VHPWTTVHSWTTTTTTSGETSVNAAPHAPEPQEPIVDLVPVVRRVVAARVADRGLRDDIVQETLVRVMESRSRIEHDTLVPYAIATARNLIASVAQREQRARRNAHLFAETDEPEPRPDEELLRQVDASLIEAAMARLSPTEREILVAHEVRGTDTATIAAAVDSTPGAVAAQLNRARARLRVEYLIAEDGSAPPTDRCRPILIALSSGDRRRQRELDSRGHLLACDFCMRLSPTLLARRARRATPEDERVIVSADSDVVLARQKGREIAVAAGFTGTELTMVATAISEIARNIVKFAKRGEFVFSVVADGGRIGLRMVARDSGPGIADVARALEDGYSTYRGLGLGLPGARRLMDEFDIVTEVGEGTTVSMIKWRL